MQFQCVLSPVFFYYYYLQIIFYSSDRKILVNVHTVNIQRACRIPRPSQTIPDKKNRHESEV